MVIDPLVPYATFLGGSSTDGARDIYVDSEGCAYVAGYTLSENFPTTTGAFQETKQSDSTAAFVTKLSADGTQALYSTYLSGSAFTTGNAVWADAAGCAYVAGSVSADDFPTTPGAYQTSKGSGTVAFITKLSPDGGDLVYSTFLSGAALYSASTGITVDNEGCAYVTGNAPDGFPTTPGAFQEDNNGADAAFVTKLNQDGSDLVFSTYLGGSGIESGGRIKVDSVGRVYVCGLTSSNDFPVTPGAYQETLQGTINGYVAVFTPDGSDLVFSTYLGGSGDTRCLDLVPEPSGTVCVCGYTDSADFPTTPGAYQDSLSGSTGGFISKLSADGTRLLASTYVGSSSRASGIAVDAQGNVYAAGSDNSYTPTVWFLDAGLTRLYAQSSWGENFDTFPTYVALGPDGSYYAAGTYNGVDFTPTTGAFQTTYGGGDSDAFVARSAFVLVDRASVAITGVF